MKERNPHNKKYRKDILEGYHNTLVDIHKGLEQTK
jgi:hypothetical protein